MNNDSEWELIRRCRQGGAAAFEPLVRTHEGPSLGYATALLGDADEAADAVQDAFIQAYRALDRLRPGSAFGPWFRTILRNTCLDRLRAPRRRSRAPLESARVDAIAWSEPIGGDRIERDQLAGQIRSALALLSDEHRGVLLLREVEGLSYAEIAQTLDIAPGTVASRLNHARAALRKVLLARGFDREDGS
jgi:RNA polymerase sigma-70 factor, ECF subfamily